jgi:hypothetical protein
LIVAQIPLDRRHIIGGRGFAEEALDDKFWVEALNESNGQVGVFVEFVEFAVLWITLAVGDHCGASDELQLVELDRVERELREHLGFGEQHVFRLAGEAEDYVGVDFDVVVGGGQFDGFDCF